MITDLTYNKNETESERQEKNALLVKREIVYLFSCPMQELLEKGLINYEDIENSYMNDQEIEEQVRNDNNIKDKEELKEIMQNFRDNGEYQKEIYEYWLVTEWLYEKLKELNEPIVEWNGLYIWGRTCTGQAIALDYTIDKVRELMSKC